MGTPVLLMLPFTPVWHILKFSAHAEHKAIPNCLQQPTVKPTKRVPHTHTPLPLLTIYTLTPHNTQHTQLTIHTGMIQAHAFMNNKARLDPIMIQLPSALHTAYTTNITLSWSGPPESRPVAYELLHAPSVSMTLQDGWYGTSAIKREYLAANVYFDRDIVVLDTSKTRGISFKVLCGCVSALMLQLGLLGLFPATLCVVANVVSHVADT